MAQTVTECLTAGTDSVTLINSINTDASNASDDTPNVKGAAGSKKTTHVAAVTTGTNYIAAN